MEQGQSNNLKPTAAHLQIEKDINYHKLPKNCIIIFPDPDDCQNFEFLMAPDKGFYQGVEFTFSFKIGPNFPYEPPKVKCCNAIIHPCIDSKGYIGLRILQEDWIPVRTINDIINRLQFILEELKPITIDSEFISLKGRNSKEMSISTSCKSGNLC